MKQRHPRLKTLFKTWFSKLPQDEVEQEELIQAWKNPDIKGYEGLAAFKELLYRESKESKIQDLFEPIKKDTPDTRSGMSLENLIMSSLNNIAADDRAAFCIIVQPLLRELYYGEDIYTLEKQSKFLGVSKSSLGRLRRSLDHLFN